MRLTKAQKLAFLEWLEALLNANKETITEANPNIPFPADEYAKMLAKKIAKAREADGKLTRLRQEKLTQTKITNDAMRDAYKTGANLVEAIVGHAGKDHELSKLIRNKRDSMVLEAARGKKKRQSE